MLTQTRLSMSSPAVRRVYRMHDIGLSVSAEPRLLHSIDRRLRTFAVASAGVVDATDDGVALTFDFATDDLEWAPPPAARPIYDPEDGQALYDEDHDRLFLNLGETIHVVSDPAAGWVRVQTRGATSRERWLASHAAVTLPLLEMLKRRQVFAVHAAGVARGGRCIVLAGGSGSGKTTLALALARAEWDFLSDDMLFLRGDDVLALPDEIDVTENTLRLIDELQPLLGEPRRPGWPKWSFRLEDALGSPIVLSCAPAAIVLPRLADRDRSVLEVLPSGQALLELVPNVLLTDHASTKAHLAALAALTARTPCYRLWTGRDLGALPGLLSELL